MNVTTKQKMYELVERGRFGNYPRWWRSIEAMKASGYRGHVSLRSLEVANQVRLYHVPADEVSERVSQLPNSQQRAGIVFSESPPDERRVIQGEWDGFDLHYTFARHPMRLAFEEQSLHASGPRARLILMAHLPVTEYEWLCELSSDFPNHVIEFSVFSVPVGLLGNHMLVWEVRAY